jgi:multidrug efflux pump subunit AcrA (membrane-fusion protein)
VLAKLEVEEGDRVAEDQLLLELDRELRAHAPEF